MNIANFKSQHLSGLIVSRFRDELLTERYVSWLNDPEVVRYSEQRHRVHSLKSCSDYIEGMKAGGNLLLAIETTHGRRLHIGNMSVVFDAPNRGADLSIIIGEKSFWGRGYASMAWSSVMNSLFYDVCIRRVTAGTMEVNSPMLRLFQRSSMTIDFIRPRHFIWEGQEVAFVGASRFLPH